MRTTLRTAAAAAIAALALSSVALAQTTATAPKSASKAATKPAKAAKPTVISVTGTVSKFDSATNTLTVTTAKGDQSFMLDSSATVMEGAKKLSASDLSAQVGHKVTVRYTESGGTKTAQSVRVSAAAAKTASAKKTSAAPKKS